MTLSAWAPAVGGGVLGLGEVTGQIVPGHALTRLLICRAPALTMEEDT